MRSLLAAIFLATACAAPKADVEAARCGFRNARGPFAQGPRPTTAEPPRVQFEPERDVIIKGEVPRVNVRIGDRGIGSYNETWNAIWHTDERGTNTLLARLPSVVWVPNSFVREDGGTMYIGMRGGVLRLTPTWPDMPRYAGELLLPERDAEELSCWWYDGPAE